MVDWNEKKDQLIIKGVFEFHKIKSSSELLNHLAKMIGEGCTPKAVSHRIANLRKSGKPVNSGGAGSTSKTARTVKSSRTPGSGARRSPVKKNVSKDVSSEEPDDEDELPVTPSANRKRARTFKVPVSYAETDGEDDGDDDDEDEFTPPSKKVKSEPVEEDEDEDEGVAFV